MIFFLILIEYIICWCVWYENYLPLNNPSEKITNMVTNLFFSYLVKKLKKKYTLIIELEPITWNEKYIII